MHLFEHET
ncbi:Protein of unknown function [Bacillus toyonensis]|nr:Protein of unknown function [Bacillus cereus]SCN17209.1 Protein of unknown function [Bacillus toyonensis]